MTKYKTTYFPTDFCAAAAVFNAAQYGLRRKILLDMAHGSGTNTDCASPKLLIVFFYYFRLILCCAANMALFMMVMIPCTFYDVNNARECSVEHFGRL